MVANSSDGHDFTAAAMHTLKKVSFTVIFPSTRSKEHRKLTLPTLE